jgi:phosphate/sulfate permease
MGNAMDRFMFIAAALVAGFWFGGEWAIKRVARDVGQQAMAISEEQASTFEGDAAGTGFEPNI